MSATSSCALFSALSAELSAMMQTVDGLSGMAADHVRQSQGGARDRALVDAQSIDDLSQRLSALSEVAAAVARGEDVAAAIGGVRLADLQSRLRGVVLASAPIAAPRPTAGDLLLFE
ncbi:hypothetical protein [Brevundimonas sp. Root1423]|uniref:hypothetical protein n=1 Tax=Brevundimonas sp. Root1423 TaxID=1736462 RepID=UPI0006F6CC25|nr:hypothetical protein [Brevundimonas sp. Root1423]KQY85031.1 hypothetical protein ASD25_08555 [Brevundimonas sp. Root1423]